MTAPVRIGPYRILFELARGGMAQIFVARRDGSRENCVLKYLLPSPLNQEAVSKRFHREAHLASFLDHPNIARIIDASFDSECVYIAMELITGKTIEQVEHEVIARGDRFPREVVLTVGLAVLDGLAYAHDLKGTGGRALGLVHRDLSPRNIMLSYAGEVKIIDFGVARGDVDDFKTAPGVLLGTIPYFSPEQARGEGVDPRSDLYAVSAILYEMLAHRKLVPAIEPLQMLNWILKDRPLPLPTSASVPAAFERVIMKGLEKDPELRWQSAIEMRYALAESSGLALRSADDILVPFMDRYFQSDDLGLKAFLASRVEDLETTDVVPKTRADFRIDRDQQTLTEEDTEVPPEVTAAVVLPATKILMPARRRPRPRGRVFTPGFVVLFAVVILGVALTVAEITAPDSITPPDPVVTTRTVTARTGPVVVPPSIAPEKIEEATTSRSKARTRAPRKAEPVDETAARWREPVPVRAEAHADLKRMMQQLRASPDDAQLLQKLYDGIKAAAQPLPGERRRRVISLIDIAQRTRDPDDLDRALDLLLQR